MVNDIPELSWYQYDTSELSDPSGERNIAGGAFAFHKIVSSGICTSGIEFGDVVFDLTTPSVEYVSTPIALLFRMDSIARGSGIDDFKFYLADDSALNGYGIQPRAFVQMTHSGIWQPNCTLPSGAGTKMEVAVPETINVYRQDGYLAYLNGIGDLDVSEYIYMNVVVPQNFPMGIAGICGSGNLTFCLKYQYGDLA